MDLTPPPLTTSPVPPHRKFISSPSPSLVNSSSCLSDEPAASYPSPTLLDYPYDAVSPCGSVEPSAAHDSWDPSEMAYLSPPTSTSAVIPGLLSAEYDPFASYEPCLSAHFPNDTYPPPPNALTGLLRTPTPSLTDASTSRSSSMTTRSPFNGIPDALPTGPSKMDGRNTFSPALEPSQFSAPPASLTPYDSHGLTFGGNPTPYMGDGSMATWAKGDFQTGQLGPLPPSQEHALQPQPQPQPQSLLPPQHQSQSQGEETGAWKTATRPRRTTRKRTTREEANFQCMVKGCGKFFSRSYNFKSHMETHDDKREYPFPCPVDGCAKKFVRKTDLQRHHTSVHMKERTHKCDYCARLFARKDTLRRHMEDGCSKRLEIGTMDLAAESYGGMSGSKRPAQTKPSEIRPALGTLAPPMTMPGVHGWQ